MTSASENRHSLPAAAALFRTIWPEALIQYSADRETGLRHFGGNRTLLKMRLMPIPEPLVEKLPKLRDARFTTDRNQSIVIVGTGNSRAELTITPN